jgi:hypothetical protein
MAKVKPDIFPPTGINQVAFGWDYNVHAVCVFEAWTTRVVHGRGRECKSGTQGSKGLYSTRALALAALRQDLEDLYSKQLREALAKVDAMAMLDKAMAGSKEA